MRVSTQRTINRVAIHDVPKQEVVAHVLSLGHTVEAAAPQERYDYVVDEKVRLALRVAYPSSSRRRVHGPRLRLRSTETQRCTASSSTRTARSSGYAQT